MSLIYLRVLSVRVKKRGVDNIYVCKIKTDDWFNRLRAKSPVDYEKELKQAGITANS